MKKILCTILQILGFLMILGTFILAIRLQLMNPDMTETRLFLTFWREYILFIIALITGVSLLIVGDKNKY